MRKKTIAKFYIPGIILVIIGLVVFIASAASLVNAASTGSVAATTGLGAGALIGDLLLFVGGILSLVAWIGTLMATAKLGRWGWFVCTILFSYITELIYLIAGPSL